MLPRARVRHPIAGRPQRTASRSSGSGQSLVEFALVLPILVFLLVGIIDLARIYTTMLSVESAAREAADYGTFGSQKWSNATTVSSVTEPEMWRRACVASKTLTDYAGPDTSCTNPAFAYELSLDKGTTWGDYASSVASGNPCNNAARSPNPCWLRVTLTYNFKLLVPLNFELFGVNFGFPTSIAFTRSSIFAMTDLTLP